MTAMQYIYMSDSAGAERRCIVRAVSHRIFYYRGFQEPNNKDVSSSENSIKQFLSVVKNTKPVFSNFPIGRAQTSTKKSKVDTILNEDEWDSFDD